MSEWMDRAACRGVDDPEIFFVLPLPAGRGSPNAAQQRLINAARFLCEHCPVQEECLDDAVGAGERWGMRGGKSPVQRGHRHRNK